MSLQSKLCSPQCGQHYHAADFRNIVVVHTEGGICFFRLKTDATIIEKILLNC